MSPPAQPELPQCSLVPLVPREQSPAPTSVQGRLLASSQPPLLQAGQPKPPQLLLTARVLLPYASFVALLWVPSRTLPSFL